MKAEKSKHPKYNNAALNLQKVMQYSFLALPSFMVGFELGTQLAGYILRYGISSTIQNRLKSYNMGFLHNTLSPYYESLIKWKGMNIKEHTLPEYGLLILGATCATILLAEAGYALLSSQHTPKISKETLYCAGFNLIKKFAYMLACTSVGSCVGAGSTILSFDRD